MTRHIACLCVLFASVFLVAVAPATAGQFSDEIYDQFEKRQWTSPTEGELLYRFYEPELEEGQTYPLIIFLHGAGERGDDNTKQFVQDHFLNLLFSEAGKKHRAYMIVPQCPTDQRWCEVDWGLPETHQTPEQPSDALRQVHELVQSLKETYPIDSRRVYITGLSMGGVGTFDYLVRYPDDIAAAIPICGGADNAKLASVEQIRTIPIWIFHGEKDTTVKTARSRLAYAALQPINADVRYTEFPGLGHISWSQAYNTQGLVEWLFAQRKAASNAEGDQ